METTLQMTKWEMESTRNEVKMLKDTLNNKDWDKIIIMSNLEQKNNENE